ncbi:DUF6786 family protein [Pontiella sulfatireligans]|uniref:Uncharacterized protein n=1 Tax=Pontiella sulfatireligans TaxID=2750658 RepID=A0A6C2UFZ0_9BACT|nr:DUF6786 family protein [Pontiella sulfatireligans]VGO19090.1 hypothetical protein SCARR_01146 [Pontiella sulfatireligans]
MDYVKPRGAMKTGWTILLGMGLSAWGALGGQDVRTFAQDVKLLAQQTDVIVLGREERQIAVVPQYQGRVMTSTLAGGAGIGFGWINHALVARGIQPESARGGLEQHIHVFGGEERFWIGPEGGQYSVFFSPKTLAYDFESWKTPSLIDTEPFEVSSHSPDSVSFTKKGQLTNKAGFCFELRIERTVSLLNQEMLGKILPVLESKVMQFVAFKTENKLTNIGQAPWVQDTGLPSIWLLGMLKHSPDSVVVIPFQADASGPVVRSDYFGAVDETRLKQVGQTIFFKADGAYRSKIGIPPNRATPIAGSYDATQGVLTLIHYALPENAASQPYVKSQWEDHERPYDGDVINAYNDGAPAPDVAPLGPFYELESSSPALALAPGQSYTHAQTTLHIKASPEVLDTIMRELLGCTLAQAKTVFTK